MIEKHKGIVVAVNQGVVRVQISLKDACQNCNSKKHCLIFSSKERQIDIACGDYKKYEIGEEVNISMKTSMGLKAVFYGYVLPVLLLIVVLLFHSFFDDERLMALIMIGIIGLYYLLLYAFRKRINTKFKFEIEKNEN